MPWFVPLIMSLISTGVGAATSISTSNNQIAAQKKQFEEQQRLEQEALNNERIRQQQQQEMNNAQTVNQFAQTMNKGYSTGTTGNQMGAGLGVGVQGLGNSGYLNEESYLARLGGSFHKKDNAKTNVRDDNNLYFDRIEYAKCGGRFSRK